MANEATIRASLSITKGNLRHDSKPTEFRATVTVGKGPSPGAINVPLAGVNVDLSELAQPGLCTIANLDDANTIIGGIGDGTEFYPLFDILPGEIYPLRLSKHLGRSMTSASAGTGTHDTGAYTLRLKAEYAPCIAVVNAFDS